MPATIKNQLILDQYKLLLNNFYAEPQNEEILGSFLDYATTNDTSARKHPNRKFTDEVPVKKKKKHPEPATTLPKIEDFFKPRKCGKKDTIIID